MALSNDDINVIKSFIEREIRSCLNYSDKKSPDEKDFNYLLLLADSGSQAVSQKFATSDLDVSVACYLTKSLEILQNRYHIVDDDESLIKLYIRLAIIEYLKEYSPPNSLSEIEKKLQGDLFKLEMENKRKLIEKFKPIYNSLKNTLFAKETLYQAAEVVFIFSLLATGYFFYNFGNVFLNVGSLNATSIAKLLYENVWSAFPYPMFSFITSGALVVFSDHWGEKLQKNINAAYFVGMTTGRYPNMNALLQEAQEKIADLEEELKNSEVLQQECKNMLSQSFTYQETTALLTQNETQANISKEASTNRSEENVGLVAGELNVAARHETENFVADCTPSVFSFGKSF